MRTAVIFLGVLGMAGVVASRHLDKMASNPDGVRTLVATAKASVPPVNVAGSRTVTLQGDARGHFKVDARVDGRPIDFMVDTGASVIALRETSAARLGIFPTPRDYSAKAQTANGVAKAARVQLARVEVNGITVRDVEAFVMPDDALGVNLLGMSFLSRVKWTHDKGRLVLEQ